MLNVTRLVSILNTNVHSLQHLCKSNLLPCQSSDVSSGNIDWQIQLFNSPGWSY